MVQNIFKINFGLVETLKSPPWTSKLNFEISHPSKKTVFVHNSFFWSPISNPISQKLFLWTIRTILVFGKNWNLIRKLSSKSRFFGKSGFLRLLWKWVNSLGVDSEKVTSGGKFPQGLLYLKNYDFWSFETCPFGENDGFPYIYCIWVQFLYIFGTYLVRGGYVVGTWLVRGWYVVGTWRVRGWYVVGTWIRPKL